MRRLLFANLLVALGLSIVASPPPTTNASASFLSSDSGRSAQSLTFLIPAGGAQIYLPVVARERDFILGVMGIPDDQLGLAVAWGGNTIEYHKTLYGPTLQSHFNTIKGLGGRLILRAIGDFKAPGGEIDMVAVTNAIVGTFAGTTVLGDPAFYGYYIMDEPCDPVEWANVTGADMALLYQTVKALDARVPVMHNFGDLNCAETRLAESAGAPIADVASFTVTYLKTSQESNIDGFLAEASAIAASVKALSPGIRVLPTAAILLSSTQPLPSEPWVETVGLAALDDLNFDGLMYYPWTTPYWAQSSLEDHSNYWDEIQRVFAAE